MGFLRPTLLGFKVYNMETCKIKERKEKLEQDIQDLVLGFQKDTEILIVDKIYVSESVVKTELKVKL